MTAPAQTHFRAFYFDEYSVEVTCPWCFGIISIGSGCVFPAHSTIGTPLDHDGDPTLGDLIDAVKAHDCEAG